MVRNSTTNRRAGQPAGAGADASCDCGSDANACLRYRSWCRQRARGQRDAGPDQVAGETAQGRSSRCGAACEAVASYCCHARW
jgi:hypothetical protein